uniref:Uncharacterized protein n=1 Tax=Corethron hystrix TaxID=216773 RepID=A0A7S1G138_9STRA|mmetsp:Transcript_7292/g.15792  ORF Transcript_7292/g.15792 Transcript_7292/m.15792 type:complete len:225 (+) Transcript_7292:60-734(+)
MSQTAMKDISETSHSIKDPLSLKRHLENEKGFKKLSYWDQMDAMVAHQACAEPTTVVFFILGLITTLLNLSVLYGLVTYGQILDGVGDTDPPGYHEVLCKTTIAWFSLAAFLGLDGMYANIIVGYGAVFRSWQVGTIKEPFFLRKGGVLELPSQMELSPERIRRSPPLVGLRPVPSLGFLFSGLVVGRGVGLFYLHGAPARFQLLRIHRRQRDVSRSLRRVYFS